jgi:hypothetical protein
VLSQYVQDLFNHVRDSILRTRRIRFLTPIVLVFVQVLCDIDGKRTNGSDLADEWAELNAFARIKPPDAVRSVNPGAAMDLRLRRLS